MFLHVKIACYQASSHGDVCTHHVTTCPCTCVPECVPVRVICRLSIHNGFMLTHYTLICYILVKSLEFILFVTIYLCFYSQVTSHNLEQTITQF